MWKTTAILLLTLSFGIAHATQTTFPVRSCANCTATQMHASAQNSMPIGINFVYDLPHHVMRKYETYMDSTCTPTPDGPLSSGAYEGKDNNDVKTDSAGNDTRCGSFRAADEMTPVDPSVQATFDALYDVSLHKADLVNNGVETMYGVPTDPHTGQPYDLQGVAWDYPNASFQDFNTTVTDALSTKDSANGLDPWLGDFLYDYRLSSFQVNVLISAPPGIGGQLSWDRNSSVRLNICTQLGGDCAKFQLTVTNGNLAMTFLGIFDVDNNIYPNANGQTPGNLTQWGFTHGRHIGAEHFADEMRHHNVYIPNGSLCPVGFHPFLTVTRQNNVIIFQTWSCQLD